MTKKSGEIIGMIGILIFVILVLVSGFYINSKLQKDPKKIIPLDQLKTSFNDGKICFNDDNANCFDIAVEKTPEERKIGLMNNAGISDDQGMLFIFDNEDLYGMWMKNTLIPLDLMWINHDGTVVFIAHDFQPCNEDFCPTITNDIKAQYVLEINAGLMTKHGIKPGSTARISLINK